MAHADARDVSEMAAELNARLAQLGFPCRAKLATDKQGLGMYASRAIEAGERVMVEQPLVATPCVDARAFTCAACFADARAQKPKAAHGMPARWSRRCAGCRTLRYCSASCEASAHARRHRESSECAALGAITREEMTTQQPLVDGSAANLLAQAVRLLTDRLAGLRVEALPGLPLAYADVAHRLVGVARDEELTATIQQAVDAALRVVPGAADALAPPELFDVLSRHQANVYGVSSQGGHDLARACFAGAMSLFNHSCQPNLAFDSAPLFPPDATADAAVAGDADGALAPRGPAFSLVSLAAVAEGDELMLAYTSVGEPRDERRRHLREYYGFDCACPRCAAPDDALDAAPRCRLDDCGTGYVVPVAAGGAAAADEGGDEPLAGTMTRPPAWRCLHCGREQQQP